MPETIRIFRGLGGHPQASVDEFEQLRLRRKHMLPERMRPSSSNDVTVWWDTVATPASTSPTSYFELARPDPVLVPAGEPEPDALDRFAGIMSEVFPGPPLRAEDIDKALRRIRGGE